MNYYPIYEFATCKLLYLRRETPAMQNCPVMALFLNKSN